jgi:hypothetical protein
MKDEQDNTTAFPVDPITETQTNMRQHFLVQFEELNAEDAKLRQQLASVEHRRAVLRLEAAHNGLL